MTEEKIKQGEELLKKLSWLKDQRSRWERACRFCRLEASDYKKYNGSGRDFSIDDSFINFDEIRLLAIAKIDKRISVVQEEFDML